MRIGEQPAPEVRALIGKHLAPRDFGRVEALELAKGRVVDVVITDVNMPNMDGITLVAQLRALPSYRLAPLLLLTTESSPERKAQGKQAGATGWMVKPFNPDQLLATLARVLGPRLAARAV